MASRGGGGGGRDRARREYSSRSDDKPRSSRPKAPPSRHLWIGNLSHTIGENDLIDHFIRFGELESVAFQPGRSYAFINFRNEDDAIAAIEALQGFSLAGNSLRIEFAKADKSSAQAHDEDHLHHRDEHRSSSRESPFSQRDSRARRASPDPYYPDKSKTSDKNVEPCEVLWIGFPASLKVDELTLRKAFSPFGEIEKVTAFPGRSYAFVRFRNVMSARRAKENLQGKLFGNPRVHICFSRSEAAPSNSGRSSMNAPLSPPFNSNGRSYENFRQDRNFGSLMGDPSMRSPFTSNLDPGDSDIYNYSRKGPSRTGENDAFEQGWFGESDLGPPPDMYECRRSSSRERGGHFDDFARRFPQKGSLYEDSWDVPEDPYLHGAKKLKTSSFPPDNDLPDYPLSCLEQEKHVFARPLSDFPQPEPFDRNLEPAGSFGYKRVLDQPMNSLLSNGDRNDHWIAPHDSFPVERKRITPESDRSSLAEWKWEGTIAKGGSPVCRARCFPVGKVLDIMLPEFLDCTARTGLDMLAKHYYQAAGAWVVFFVPGSDADIGFYNEFMHYLEEKQRAAVAKLDDKTTLFLVPPSDFSEKVLKVPGKLSISGVILRLELPSSNIRPLHHPNEALPFNGDPSRPSVPFPSVAPYPDMGKSGVRNPSLSGNAAGSDSPGSFLGSDPLGNMSNSYNENRHGHSFQWNPSAGSNWSPHHQQNSVSGANSIPQMPSNSFATIIQEHHPIIPQTAQQSSSSNNTSGIFLGNPSSGNNMPSLPDTRPSVSLPMPVAALKPEQLAQLASSLLGQQRQSVSTPNVPVEEDSRQLNTMNLSENPHRTSQRYPLQNNQVTPELPLSQFGQVQQLQQHQQQISNVPAAPPPTVQREFHTQQLQSSGAQDEADSDPQKRLQATLHLAASLLQQIQQGKGT